MVRHARVFVLLALALVCLAAAAPGVAARTGDRAPSRQTRLAYPPAPAAGYQPRLVQQLYNNCAFASAEMLIDKWTRGRRHVPQASLRRATGIASADGGPTLAQLSRAVAQVGGIDLRWSPNGGDPLTYSQLLGRLADGGGALVNLWPAKLPGQYRRWLPALTAGHSVYVERYQPANDRLWLMDPLGRGRGFRGEWISADALSRAIWRSGEHVWAAATPTPPREPSLADFELGSPDIAEAGFSADSMAVAIGYAPRRPDATLPTMRLAARWQRVPMEAPEPEPTEPPAVEPAPSGGDEPDATAAIAQQAAQAADENASGLVADGAVPSPTADAAVPAASSVPVAPPVRVEEPVVDVLSEPLTAAGGLLSTHIATPSAPGDYRVVFELRDPSGHPLATGPATFAQVTVRVRGSLAGHVELGDAMPPTATYGEVLSLSASVTNLGSAGWAADAGIVSLSVSWDGADAAVTVPLALGSGQTAVVPVAVPVDAEVGRRRLVISLEGDGATVAEAEAVEMSFDVVPAPAKPAEID